MRAIILAGGKGTRLAPLTEVIPKPLVPIGGQPIMEIVIRQLRYYGFKHVTMAVGYMAGLIQAYFQDGSKWGIKIDYSCESTPLGTAGPLTLIGDTDETFLMMNADILTNLDFHKLIEFHRTQGGIATVGAFYRQVSIDLGVIIPDGEFIIKDYVEKPTTTHLVSMGVYVFEPDILNFIHGIDSRGKLDFPDLVKSLLQQKKSIHFYPFQGYWLDIGRHEDYFKAANDFETLQKKYRFLPDEY